MKSCYAYTTLEGAYSVGDTVIALASGGGALVGTARRIALVKAAVVNGAGSITDGGSVTVFNVLRVNGDTLIVALLSGTAQSFAVGDLVVIDSNSQVALDLLHEFPFAAPLDPAITGVTLATVQSGGGGGGSSSLTPTAVKTSAYTAAVGDLVVVDTTSGGVTVTLPAAPADKSQIAVKVIATTDGNATTVACGGSDVINKAGGSTSISLILSGHAALLQYAKATGIWYVVADDLPLGQLDSRYLKIVVDGASPSFTAAANTLAIQTALNAASAAGGGWVMVTTPGTYLLAPGADATALALFTCLYIGSNVRFTAGPGVTFKLLGSGDHTTVGACLITNADHVAGNSGFTVEGGTWDQDQNVQIGGGTLNHPTAAGGTLLTGFRGETMLFYLCTSFLLRDMSHLNAAWRSVHIENCSGFKVKRVYADSYDDGIHLVGPLSDFEIGWISGQGDGNFLALLTDDYSTNLLGSGGAISNGHYHDCDVAARTTTGPPFQLAAGSAGGISNILYERCSYDAKTYAAYMIEIADDGTVSSGGHNLVGGPISRVTFRSCRSNGGLAFFSDSGLTDVLLDDCDVVTNTTAAGIAAVYLKGAPSSGTSSANHHLTSLTISNSRFSDGGTGALHQVLLVNAISTKTLTVDAIRMLNVEIVDSSTNNNNAITLGSGGGAAYTLCPLVQLSNFRHVSTGNTTTANWTIAVTQSAVTLTHIECSNVSTQSTQAFLYAASPVAIEFTNLSILNAYQCWFSYAAGTTVALIGTNFTNDHGGGPNFSNNTSGTSRVSCATFQYNLTTAHGAAAHAFTPSVGDQFYNNNASDDLSLGVGLVVWNGSAWTPLGNLDARYLAASSTSITRYTQPPVVVTVAANAGTIDWSLGNKFTVALPTGATTLTFTNVPAGTSLQSIEVDLQQPNSGTSGTVTWALGSGTVGFGTAGTPTLSAAASSATGPVDMVQFRNVSATYVRGYLSGQGFAH